MSESRNANEVCKVIMMSKRPFVSLDIAHRALGESKSRSNGFRRVIKYCCLSLATMLATSVEATTELLQFSMEELMTVEVTSHYGDSLGEDSSLRAYAKVNDYDDFKDSEGDDAYDGWKHRQAGFRAVPLGML